MPIILVMIAKERKKMNSNLFQLIAKENETHVICGCNKQQNNKNNKKEKWQREDVREGGRDQSAVVI